MSDGAYIVDFGTSLPGNEIQGVVAKYLILESVLGGIVIALGDLAAQNFPTNCKR